MIYLADNDVVQKLATHNLIDDALSAYDASRSDVMVLPTLRYRLGIGTAKAVERLGQKVADRLAEFLDSVKVIEDYSHEDHDLLEHLDKRVEIDAGEIILFSATAQLEDYLLFTGDKRCLKALASSPECARIAQRIQGRVACFEQIIHRVIDVKGYDFVKEKILPVLQSGDSALRAAFGSGVHATRENTCECLRSYIAEIRAYPIDLLMPDI